MTTFLSENDEANPETLHVKAQIPPKVHGRRGADAMSPGSGWFGYGSQAASRLLCGAVRMCWGDDGQRTGGELRNAE